MIYIGIDVAKDKHDCFITNDDGEVLFKAFTIPNNQSGFAEFYRKIMSVCDDVNELMVGLEATGHYCYNLMEFLTEKKMPTYVINPLHTNLYRKSLTLRKTKTDKVDAAVIAQMLMSDVNMTYYSRNDFMNEELKSLTRYRFDKVRERAKLRISIARLVCILFPELEKLIPTLHMNSIYNLLEEYPGASQIAGAHLTRLTNLLSTSSNGHYGKEMANTIRDAARASIGVEMPAKSLELKHTIQLVREFDNEMAEIEGKIKEIVDEIDSPILTIPGINYHMGALIIGEIGAFSRFENPDKILAYAGLSPTTYQSGQLEAVYAHMEKRGSKYLRYALFNTTKFVCRWDPTFAEYLAKKRAEGKHYNVAISHAAKKLVRVMYHLETTGEAFAPRSDLRAK